MSSLAEEFAEGVPRWPLAVMRIYAGLVFLGAASAQLPPHTNARLVIAILELTAAVALTLGLATRGAALLGVVIVVGHMLPIHGGGFLVSPGPRTAFVMLLLTVMLGRSGRVFGLDALLANQQPRNPLC